MSWLSKRRQVGAKADGSEEWVNEKWPCPTVQALIEVYADRIGST
jgi:hypothetical protein